MSLVYRLSLVLVSLVGCRPTAAEISLVSAIALGPQTASYAPSLLGDSLQIYSITAVAYASGVAAIADMNDRVLILDENLTHIRTIGGRGAGPGELLHPQHVSFWQGNWVVADAGNARLTLFAQNALPRWSMKLPTYRGQGIALTTDSAVIYPMRDDRFYARRQTLGGMDTVWAPRSWPPGRDLTLHTDFPGLQKDYIAVTGVDTLYVCDGDSLIFRKYAPTGEFLEQRALPRALRDALLNGAGTSEEVFGGRRVVRYSPAVVAMSVTTDGRLLLTTPARSELPGVIGLLVDPTEWTVAPINASAVPWVVDAAHERYYVALDADRLLFATHSGRLGIFSRAGVQRVN